MRHRRAAQDLLDGGQEHPAAGLVNLFDLWIVFAVAILSTTTGIALDELQEVEPESRLLEERLTPTGRALEGKGTRLGVAYRLQSGEIVYVPAESAEGPRDGDGQLP